MRRVREYSEAERAAAHEFARQKVAEAKAYGATDLNLNPIVTGNKTRVLTELPPEISDLSALQVLDLSHTPISDLTALADLSGLQTLLLDNMQVSDLTALAGLSGLQVLILNGTQVSDLTALAGLSGLQELHLSNTQVSDLTALEGLSGLQTLSLHFTPVSDLTALGGLSGLLELSLNITQFSDLTALAGLSGLQRLDLDNTQVSDLTALAGLSGLQQLDLDNTQVSDLTALAGLSGLQQLRLDNTQVSDLTALARMSGLRRLSYKGTPAAEADEALAAINKRGDTEVCARETLWYLNGRHPEFNGSPGAGASSEPVNLPKVVDAEWQSDDEDNPVLRGGAPEAASGRNSLNPERQAALMVAAGEAADLLLEQARSNRAHPDIERYLQRYRTAVGQDLHAFIPNTPNVLAAMVGGLIDDNSDTPRVVADGFAAFHETHRQMMTHFPAEEDLEDAAEAAEIDADAVPDLPQKVLEALDAREHMIGAEIREIVEGNAARLEVLSDRQTEDAKKRRRSTMLAVGSVAVTILSAASSIKALGPEIGWSAAKAAWAFEQMGAVAELLRPIVEKLRQMWPNIRFPD
ncbi:MAG: leucine-rich repeat domain-containing protein [Pseudomonadota bacterium]